MQRETRCPRVYNRRVGGGRRRWWGAWGWFALRSVLVFFFPPMLPRLHFQAGFPVKLLSVQYRMRHEIRQFPSDFFYGGRLMDSPCVSARPPAGFHKVWNGMWKVVWTDYLEGGERLWGVHPWRSAPPLELVVV